MILNKKKLVILVLVMYTLSCQAAPREQDFKKEIEDRKNLQTTKSSQASKTSQTSVTCTYRFKKEMSLQQISVTSLKMKSECAYTWPEVSEQVYLVFDN